MAKSKTFSLIYKQLVKWFVKIVWPWVVENIWPEIEKQIIAIFIRVVNAIRDLIFQWVDNRKDHQEKTANKKAEEASNMAEKANSESESEKYRAVAQVWREVADEFRLENELLKAKFEEAVKKATVDFREDLHSMEMTKIIEEGENASLRIRGSQTILQLPEPNDKT